MPCVFPVISLKILSFTKQAGEDSQKLRQQGWVFTLGVLVSFWLLTALLWLLKMSGHSLGWGFQLQSPYFVAAMIVVLLMVALNLFGLFEFGFALTRLGAVAPKDSNLWQKSFSTGVLTTLLATPCTAPFMGVALGFALTQSYATAWFVFTALALGLSLPYIILSYMPQWLQKLPKPGPWMESFRQLMGFPVLATMIWLLWVLAQQLDIHTLFKVIFVLLLVSLGCWLLGKSHQTHGSLFHWKRLLAYILIVAPILMAGQYIHKASHAVTKQAMSENSDSEIFSKDLLKEYLAANKPVFIEFSAAWCLTCQLNKQNVLSKPDVQEMMDSYGVKRLYADWTRYDEEITKIIESYGRSGVPLYILHYAADGNYGVLPEVLTKNMLERIFQENLILDEKIKK